jgi:hypothetical protein
VSGGIDDVDQGFSVPDGGVFGKDGNAALALDVVGVHDAIWDFFPFAEDSGLSEEGVYKGGFAVIDVSYDGDVANGKTHNASGTLNGFN